MSILYFYNHTNYFNLNSVSPKCNGTRAPSYVSFHVTFTWIGSGFGEPNLKTPVGLRLQPNLNTNQNGLCLDSRLEQIWTDLFTRYFPVGPMGGRSGDGRAACSPSVGGARAAMTPAPCPPVAQPPPPLPFSYASLSRPSASSPCSYPGSASLPLSWNHTHWGMKSRLRLRKGSLKTLTVCVSHRCHVRAIARVAQDSALMWKQGVLNNCLLRNDYVLGPVLTRHFAFSFHQFIGLMMGMIILMWRIRKLRLKNVHCPRLPAGNRKIRNQPGPSVAKACARCH